ncbi:MAG: Crp/Fnr family transcriptional regulator [Chlorobi bacterium]|nr:Crp/Fnr family transcriptional regulator [Chlorobiota bacterium]
MYAIKQTRSPMKNCNLCLIRHLNALKELSPEELDRISLYKRVQHYKKGDQLLREGQNTNGIFCIMSGKGKLTRYNSLGKEQIVRFIKSGNLIGYRSAISNEPPSLNLTALEDMTACFIPKEAFEEALENRQFARRIMEMLSEDLKQANLFISNLSQHTVRERLADTLLNLEETFGTDKEGNINIALSREELSSIIGTASESVIRVLSAMKKEGIIYTKAKKIKLLDKTKLKQIAEGILQ